VLRLDRTVVKCDEGAAAEHPRKGPTIETVERLAAILEVSLDRELEDRFYNAFGYASPRQLAAVKSYLEQKEVEEDELPPTGQ
jgi:Mn-dependent DtxR family transcriptional regulator